MKKALRFFGVIGIVLFLFGFSQRFDQPIQDINDIEDLYNDGIIDENRYSDLVYFFENKLDPNFATIEDLEALPGVEPLDAQNIVNYRDRVGGYSSREDLLKVPGIDELKLQQFENFLTFELVRKRRIPIKGEFRFKISDSQDKPSSYSSTTQKKIAIDDKPDIDQYLRLFFTERYEVGLSTVGDYVYNKVYFVNNRAEVFDKKYEYFIGSRYLVLKNARSRFLNKVIIGDYRARYGQIKVGRAISVGTLSRVRNISESRLRGSLSYSSSDEHGIAVLSRWNFRLTSVLFYSNSDLAARYYNKDNPIYKKDIYVLDSSEKLPGLVKAQKFGLNINYSFPSSYIDLNLWNYQFRKYYDFELSDFPNVRNAWSFSAFYGRTLRDGVVYASYVRKMHSGVDALGAKAQFKFGDLRWSVLSTYKEPDKDIDESVGEFEFGTYFRQRIKYGRARWYIDFDYSRVKETDINFLFQDSLLDYAAKEYELDTTTIVALSKKDILKTSEDVQVSLEGQLTRYLTVRLRRKWSDDNVLREEGNDISNYITLRLRPFSRAYLYLEGSYTEQDVKYPSKYKERLDLTTTFRYTITKPLQFYFRYKLRNSDLSKSFNEYTQYTLQLTYKITRDFSWRLRYYLSDYFTERSERYYFEIKRKW